MPDENKKSKFSVPYTIILFLFVATIPALISDNYTRTRVDTDTANVVQLLKQKGVTEVPTVTVTPTLSPTATPSATQLQKSFTLPRVTAVPTK